MTRTPIAGAEAMSSTCTPSPQERRAMEQNIPAGNNLMRFKPFSIFRISRRGLRGIHAAGFTLLELMIVLTIILILASIAGERYDRSVQHAREATLKQDLFVMRT